MLPLRISRSLGPARRLLLPGSALAAALLVGAAGPAEDGAQKTKVRGEVFHSEHLDGDLMVLPSVFFPNEAEKFVLPFMKENAARFDGATVLEIGTGSGPISLYASKLGAAKVVATDINERALINARKNAERLGLEAPLETRLVPQSDMSAYSVIGPDERFDVIISNPPYSLDLDAAGNTPVIDRGDLGLSIVRGLDAHLTPGGVAILLYNSLFYHYVMVKFARHQGFEARSHTPAFLTEWEAEALFNHYLKRLLEVEQVDPDAFRFDHRSDPLDKIMVYDSHRPLFPGNSNKRHPGMIVIESKRGRD